MLTRMLIIRDPDWETHTVTDGDIETYEIDTGASFNGMKDLQRCLEEDNAEAIQWLARHIAHAASLPENSNVRAGIDEFVGNALEDCKQEIREKVARAALALREHTFNGAFCSECGADEAGSFANSPCPGFDN